MKKVIIIAEAGVNHNGDLQLAYKLVDAAAESGADYIKFQTFITDLIVDKSAEKAQYQIRNTGGSNSQYEMIKKLELSFDDFHKINSYCKKKGIKFLTSVADLVSLSKLKEYDLDFIKIGSGELTNLLFLSKVALHNKPVVISTGMSGLSEIEVALSILNSGGIDLSKITVLHCNTDYPTKYLDVNLKAMRTIADAFKVNVGYSDHSLGIEIPVAAVALGATIVEKHFTIDKKLTGPDHSASLEPHEFKLMVESIRNVELALSGKGIKTPSNSELKNVVVVRKSIFAAKKILKGDKISEENIIIKRPGDGIPANQVFNIIGKIAAREIEVGCKLSYKDIEW